MSSRAPAGRRGAAPAQGVRWLVAVPAWGERCVDVLIRSTLPALLAAVTGLGRPVEIWVWTDQTERVDGVFPDGVSRRILPVPGPDGAFESMSNCHREVLRASTTADRVLLLTADMVLSREVLATCEAVMSAGRQLVCCVAMRALEQPLVPVGATGRELLSWAWDNRHRMTRECTWPEGRSYDVWRMYFEEGGEVAARVFLPHPLACAGGRRLPFRPTIDVNLAANFEPSATYMITQPEEGAVVELSPADKEFILTTSMRDRALQGGPSCPPFVRVSNARHRMFFEKRVVIRGAGGPCGDGEVVRRVLG